MRKTLCILAFFTFTCYAQEPANKDAIVWAGWQLNLPITKKLDLGVESQTRFYKNATQLRTVYGELKIKYGFGHGFSLSGIYRYSRVKRSSYYENDNRFCIDGAFRYKMEFGLNFKVRLRYQHSFDRIKMINEVYPDRKNMIRTSLKIQYKHKDFKRVQPYFGSEIYYAVAPKNKYSFWDTYRLKVGIMFDLPKRHEISIFYMFEHENRSVADNNHIYGLQYAYTFRRLNKKKKTDRPTND